MQEAIDKAITLLKKGGIVIFPTDTAFGIGCLIDNEESIKRLFKLRRRPETQAVSVLVDTVKMVQNYVKPIPKEVIDTLIEPYWPGGLTIVLQSRIDTVPALVRGGGETIGIRIPAHPITRAIIRGVGKPLLGPSANFHGKKTPYTLSDLDPELVQLVDFVVEEESYGKEASTVIDCSQKPWRVLREGAIKIAESKWQLANSSKKDVVLYIDTSSNEKISVTLRINKKKDQITEKIGRDKAQVVLPILETLLHKHSLTVSDITSIKVHTGPGSFTGLRVGVSIANALSYALSIPVNGQKIGELVEPVYE